MARGELDQAGRVHAAHPGRVELDARLALIEDLEDLLFIGLGVGLDLLGRQWRPRGVLARGVADHPGKVADQEDDLVPELLKLPHLVDQHSVAEVQIRGRRVEPRLHDEGPPELELRLETVLGQDFVRAASQLRDLFLDRAHTRELYHCPARF